MKQKNNTRKRKKGQNKSAKLKISYTSKPITAYGGHIIFAKLFKTIKLKEFFNTNTPIEEKSNRSIGIFPKILGYFLTILIGGDHYSHIDYLGSKNILAEMFEVKSLPANSSPILKMFSKFKAWKMVEEFTDKIWEYTFNLIFAANHIEDWLTFDSTVLERYGKQQEGSFVGYNPKKKGRPSHHPLIAFLNKTQYVVNLINRSGNTGSSNNIVEFYNQTVTRLKTRISIKGILADSGFYKLPFLQALEKNNHNYIITVAFYRPLQQILHTLNCWQQMADGLEVVEFYYKHDNWDKKRRYIAIRQEISKRPDSSGKQLRLFPEHKQYRYSLHVTNIEDMHPVDIWDSYKPRAADENIIKTLKDDFGLSGFTMKSFFVTELAMILRVLLYNLFVYFKSNFLNKNEKTFTLKRLKPKYFHIPAILGSGDGYKKLRLGIPNQSIRAKFQSILAQLNQHSPPVRV